MPYLLLWHPRVATEADTATVYLDLQVTASEAFAGEDTATVYLDLQVESIFIQVDFLLEIVDYTRRWTVGRVERRWEVHESVRRWTFAQAMARWIILETRRFFWRN